MRISTSQLYANGVNSMLSQQAKLSKTQLQVATGQKILTPSD
ncbi:MAG: flagellar hook-associated protein 3 FlgL, partial [Zhongshania aliphaticivorans]